MKSKMLLLFCCVGFLSPELAQAQEQTQAEQAAEQTEMAEELTSRVRTIASHAKSESRLSAVVTLLDGLDVEYKVEEFEFRRKSGKNVVVTLGPDADSRITIGAHYDQVQVGQGAVDNACSCAALIELIEQFKAEPLTNHSLEVVFFDLEEVGLLGAEAYVKQHKESDSLPAYFINVDIFGYGDAMWLMSEDEEGDLSKAFAVAAEQLDFPSFTDGIRKYPPSDHVPFAKGGVPTIGVALIDQEEIEVVKALLSGQQVEPPPILKTIHTPDDTVEVVKAEQSAKAIPLLEAAIRSLDSR